MNIIRKVNQIAIVCLLQFFLAGTSWALVTATPTQEWAATFDGSASLDDSAVVATVDNDGNVYVTGQSSNSRIQTIKYDQNGNELWVASYVGPGGTEQAKAITVDAQGNVYVAGQSYSGSGYDAVTIKYSNSGVEQWVMRATGVGVVSAIGHYVDSDDGNTYIYITGGNSASSSSSNYVTVKYAAADGSEQWTTSYDGPEGSTDVATAMAVDSTGSVYITGNSYGGVVTAQDFATIKYSKGGVQQWAMRHAGPLNNKDTASAIGIDSLGGVYVTGSTSSDSLTVKYSAAGVLQWEQVNTDAYGARALAIDSADNVIITSGGFTVKYNSAGDQLWAISDADAGAGGDLVVDESNNIYITGYVDGLFGVLNDYDYATIMYNAAGVQQWIQNYASSENGRDIPVAMAVYEDTVNQTTYVIVAGSGGVMGASDFITVKYDSSGVETWVQRYDGTGSSAAYATDIDVDSNGNVYVTGKVETGGKVDTGYDDIDYVTTKYGPDGAELWVAQSGNSAERDSAVGVAVDSAGNVYITAMLDTSSGEDIVTVKYNAAGEVLGQITFNYSTWDTAFDIALFIDPDDGQAYVYVFASISDSNLDRNYALIKYDANLVEQWVRTYTYASGHAYPGAFTVDNNGNAYLTGKSETVAGFYAYATVKFDKNGNELWDYGYDLDGQGDNATAIAIDNEGNVYVTGEASYRAEWVNNQYLIGYDCITIKYNAIGEEQWVARYDQNGEREFCKGIAVDNQGNVFVAGNVIDPLLRQDYITIKYNAAGVQQWANQWDGGFGYYDQVKAIAVNNIGLVYVTGESTTTGASDYATIAYDTDGNELWLQRYNNGNTPYSGLNNRPVAMLVKDDGNVYVTGESIGIGTGVDFGTIKYSQVIVITNNDLPVITGVTPVDQASGIAITSLVTATFSEAMDQLNIEDSSTFTLRETLSGTLVSGAVLYDDVSMIARFTPDADLAYNTQFTATISTAATDASGNALADDRVWQFTTVAEPDFIAPFVLGRTPQAGASGVEISVLISVRFNESMDGSSISGSTFIVEDTTTGSPVTGNVSYDAGTSTARFDLVSSLAYNTDYTVTVSTGATDLAGNSLASDVVWSFTTGVEADITPPVVLPGSLSPASGAMGVAINLATVSAAFSESIDESSITTSTFTLFNNSTRAYITDGAVTYNAGRAVMTLGSDLAYGSSYTATISASVADISGNTLVSDFSWNFSTENEPPAQENTPPQVISVTPTGASVPAAVGAVSVSFSESVQGIDAASFIVSATANAIPGTVQYDSAAMTAWFYPASNLEFNTQYTVMISSALVSDLAGNSMSLDYQFSFTTGGDPALAGCEPELQQEAGCTSFDYFTYGTGVDIDTYGSSISGYSTESAARGSVSYDQPLTEADIGTSTFESQAVASVDSTGLSLRSRSRRMELSDSLAGAWSMGATKIDVSGVPPGTLIPMSIVMSGNFTGNGGSLLLQVNDFDDYRGLGSVSVAGSGSNITYTQMIDPYGNKQDAVNYVKTTGSASNNIRLDFLYPAVPNNGIYVWFVAGVHGTLSSGETDFTATLDVNPPPGVTVTLASGKIFTSAVDSDGDGVSDIEDSSPNDASIASPASATGTGSITINVSDNAGVTLSQIQVLDDDDLSLIQSGKPADQQFPDGIISFRLNGIAPGGTATVNLRFPTAFPDGAKYYKVNETGFYEFPGAVINGNTVTLTITDGGLGDNDDMANGVIVDPGGVAIPIVGSPVTTSPVATSSNSRSGLFGIGAFDPLMLLALFMWSVISLVYRRRR